MKILIKILILFSITRVYSQGSINCESVQIGIKDKNLYDTLKNGKVLFRINLNKEEVFLIRNTKNDTHYFVTKELMKKIKKLKCDNIAIEKLKNIHDKEAPKIVRD